MKNFKQYATALRKDVLNWIQETAELDILVGIPSFNNGFAEGYFCIGWGLPGQYPGGSRSR